MKKREIVLIVLSLILVSIFLFVVQGYTVNTESADSSFNVGWYSSIALDSNGKVHISYRDEANNYLKYCNNTAGTWSCMNVDTTGDVGMETSIAIDSNNKVHISHYDNTNADLRYCNNTAGTWSCMTIDTVGNAGVSSSIAIDSNDKVHISHSNISGLKYCNNTAGTWSCTTVDSTSTEDTSIALDSNNKVHIAHSYTGYYLKYCNNTAGTWSCTTIIGSGTREPSIAIDSNNKVHISYLNGSTDFDLRYCNNTATDSSWSCVAVDTTNMVGEYSSIAIDSNNKVHISHYDNTNRDLRYCNNAEGFWSCVKLVDTDANYLGKSNGRALAIKKGRIVDSTSFSSVAHISWFFYDDSKYLMYTNVSLDITAPRISISYPSNNSNYSTNTVDINYTVSDVNLQACWYSNDTMTLNTTITCGVNITTITWSEGKHNVTVWANDSTNNLNSSRISFTIDTISPTITSFTCSPSSTTVGGTVTCTCSGTDTTSGISSTSYTANPSTSSTGTFTLTCTITDYAGNSASSTTTYTVTSGGVTPSPSQSQTFTQITPSQPAEMTITNPEIDLTKITIATTETVTGGSLKITKTDVSQADLGIGLPTGKVYQAFEINATKLNETNLANVTIEFKINKTWLLEQNGTPDNVNIYRKIENVWNPWQALNTTLTEEDSNFYYFSAVSPGFSTFMIFFGKYECSVGEKKCFNDQVQLCLGNYTWMITEKCKFGCKDDKCVSPTQALKFGSAMFYVVVGLISMVIIVVVYFIYKSIKRKRVGGIKIL